MLPAVLRSAYSRTFGNVLINSRRLLYCSAQSVIEQRQGVLVSLRKCESSEKRTLCTNTPHVIQMTGLDFEVKEEDIIGFFKPLGITPSKIRLRCDIAGRVSGLCEVEFETQAEAVIAMRKKNAFIGSRFIRLMYKPVPGAIGNANEKINFEEPVVPKQRHVPDVDRTSFTAGHFVRVRNLPQRITEQSIYYIFWPLNIKPVSVQAVYDENGIRTGDFDVEFLTHEDAVAAMVRNNFRVGHRNIELSLKSDVRPVPRPDAPEAPAAQVRQN